MAKEISQLMQSWLPTQPVADATSQQRILELEAELAKVKSASGHVAPAPSETPGTSSTPIGRALQRQQAPSTTFDPSCLLVSPGSVNP